MNKRFRYYGVKFPFTKVGEMNSFVDLNENKLDAIKSEMMHLIYTPIGQRLRNPNFGTKLIQFFFSPNDSQTKEDIEFEIKEKIKTNIPDCEIISMDATPEGDRLQITIKFTAKIDAENIEDKITLTI